LNDGLFQNAIGFESGNYPANQSFSTPQIFYSTTTPLLTPAFVKIFYKPSNPQFASQGGVSSGEVTLRNKYNTIQTSAASMGSVYGNGVADALSYGVSENIYTSSYTQKDKTGYPVRKYPKFTKTGEMRTCDDKSIRG
jgi:hypothetical protein